MIAGLGDFYQIVREIKSGLLAAGDEQAAAAIDLGLSGSTSGEISGNLGVVLASLDDSSILTSRVSDALRFIEEALGPRGS